MKIKNLKTKKKIFEFGRISNQPDQPINKNREKLNEIFRKKNYDINYFKEKFIKKWDEYALKVGMNEQKKRSPNVEDFVTYIISVYGVPKEIAKSIRINFDGKIKNIIELAKTNQNDKFNKKQFEELVNQIAKFETAYVTTGGKYDPEYIKDEEEKNTNTSSSTKDTEEKLKSQRKEIIELISKLDDNKISKLLDILKKIKV